MGGDFCAGFDEEARDCGVVALIVEPAVFAAVHRPVERRGLEIVVGKFEGSAVFEEEFDGGRIAVPGGPVEGRGVVLTARVDGEAGFEKEAEGNMVSFAGGIGDSAMIRFRDSCEEVFFGGEEALDGRFVSKPAVIDQLDFRQAAVDEEFKDFVSTEFFGDLVRGNLTAERPEIDCSAGARIGHREGFPVDALANGVRIFSEMSFGERDIAERRSHEEISPGAALDQKADDVLMIADLVLGRRGFVVDVFGVDFSAVIEKEFGDFDIAREMKGAFAVTARRIDDGWIGGDEFAKFLKHAETRSRVGFDASAALDGVLGEIVVSTVEQAKPARPPFAFGVDVGAVFEKDIEHFARTDVIDGISVEWADCGIDEVFQRRVLGEERANGCNVVVVEGGLEALLRRDVHLKIEWRV